MTLPIPKVSNANKKLTDAMVKNQIKLEKFSASHIKEIQSLLFEVQDEIVSELTKIDPTVGSIKRKQARLVKLLNKVNNVVGDGMSDIAKLNLKNLNGLADVQLENLQKIYNNTIGAEVTNITLVKRRLESLVDNSMINGRTIKGWWDKKPQDFMDRFEPSMRDAMRQIQIGSIKGEPLGELIRRVKGSTDLPGMMKNVQRETEALVRTSVMQVAGDTNQAFLNENADLFNAWQWVATLDKRTTPLCKARDGKLYDVKIKRPIDHGHPFLGGPPAHWQCRSVLVGVTKPYEELIDSPKAKAKFRKIPEKKRAALGGPVSQKMNYNDWLKEQTPDTQKEILGLARYKLWSEGKITNVDQLVRSDGSQFTLDELRTNIDTTDSILGYSTSMLDANKIGENHGVLLASNIDEAAEQILEDLMKIDPAVLGDVNLQNQIRKNWKKKLKGQFDDLDPELKLDLQNALNFNYGGNVPKFTKITNRLGKENTIFTKPRPGGPAAEKIGGTNFVYDHKFQEKFRTNSPFPGSMTTSEWGGLNATIRHEYAHSLFEAIDLKWRQEFRNTLSELGEDAVTKGLTRYSKTKMGVSGDEAFSELFAVITDPKYDPKKFPKWVNDLGDKIYKKVLTLENRVPLNKQAAYAKAKDAAEKAAKEAVEKAAKEAAEKIAKIKAKEAARKAKAAAEEAAKEKAAKEAAARKAKAAKEAAEKKAKEAAEKAAREKATKEAAEKAAAEKAAKEAAEKAAKKAAAKAAAEKAAAEKAVKAAAAEKAAKEAAEKAAKEAAEKASKAVVLPSKPGIYKNVNGELFRIKGNDFHIYNAETKSWQSAAPALSDLSGLNKVGKVTDLKRITEPEKFSTFYMDKGKETFDEVLTKYSNDESKALGDYLDKLLNRGPATNKKAANIANKYKINDSAQKRTPNASLRKFLDELTRITGGKKMRLLTDIGWENDRAFANKMNKYINIGKGSKTTFFHEFGHVVEFDNKNFRQACKDFIDQKRSNSKKKWLGDITGNKNYRSNEFAFEDKFVSPYVGKWYDDGFTEVLSVGLEHFESVAGMMKLYNKDKDHFYLIVGFLEKLNGRI